MDEKPVDPSVSKAFAGLKGNSTTDDFLGAVAAHHVQMSAMADVKANIIITASSIVLTLALNNYKEPAYRVTVMLLLPFVTLALLFAIVAVLPKHQSINWPEGTPRPSRFNLLFFGHYASMSKERYLREMAQVIKDPGSMYEAACEDIYGVGHYMDAYKYRYLRWSYGFFLAGFLLAGALVALRLLMT